MGLLRRDVGETVSITWQLELDAASTWRHLVDLGTWPTWVGSPVEGSLHPGVQLIVDHGEASALGSPLPMSQFWRIHQTLEALGV